jgi:hypothetical protein
MKSLELTVLRMEEVKVLPPGTPPPPPGARIMRNVPERRVISRAEDVTELLEDIAGGRVAMPQPASITMLEILRWAMPEEDACDTRS